MTHADRKPRRLLAALGLFLLALPLALGAGEKHGDHGVPHQPRDPEAYLAMLEREGRDSYQKPEEVLEALGLRPGMDVADIGAGSGYFTRRAAPLVGPEGTVYALDIEEAFLERIREDAKALGLANVKTVLTPPDRPALPGDSVDLVLIVNTWHHIADPAPYLEAVHRVLRPGGRLVQIDWVKEKTPFGPRMEHRISRKALVAQMEGAGFRLRSEHFFLPYHYFLVFEASGEGGEE